MGYRVCYISRCGTGSLLWAAPWPPHPKRPNGSSSSASVIVAEGGTAAENEGEQVGFSGFEGFRGACLDI